MKFVLLKDVSEEEAAVLCPLLEAHGIQTQMRYTAMATPGKVFLGRSVFGNNISVPEDQLEEAKELLAELSKEIPPEELEAQALAAGGEGEGDGEAAPAPSNRTDFDWKIEDYGLDK